MTQPAPPRAVRRLPLAAVVAVLLALWPMMARAQGGPPVGLRRIEVSDPRQGGRHVAVAMFYPAAALPAPPPSPVHVPFATHVTLFLNAPFTTDGRRHPLVLLSHGRGSNAMVYAWFAQALAEHGYIVAGLNHWRANTYDSRIDYLANKLWQRPRDISLVLTDLLRDPTWGARIDPARIGVAGHSQGGFTALWVAGARVNADRYAAFQRRWHDDRNVPAHLRRLLTVDPAPALDVHDPRIRAAFAMAPGVIQLFGMDPAGLAQLGVPAYLIVGAGDTTTPAASNAAFAARSIPHATLNVLPGPVGHEIFTNECDEDGRDSFPGGCIDAPGVDRAKLHAEIGAEAVAFFGRALDWPDQARP